METVAVPIFALKLCCNKRRRKEGRKEERKDGRESDRKGIQERKKVRKDEHLNILDFPLCLNEH